MEKIIIAAASINNVIGKENKIPWDSKEELLHFKQTTMGYPIIMGRKTFEVIGKPLKGRTNIVITRREFIDNNVIVFNEIAKALDFCESKKFEKVFIIGGSHIFNQMINDVDRIILSRMKFISNGDKFFPEIDMNIWKLVDFCDYNDFTVFTYVKK
ncbi:dihydrofolate reductase [Melioribacteraceae bacterium 4301-Me]|uniref:dihydrofolate reductase n=1 Tax=Pyranulibacter aquaticus TaxID=3163344 RepID=UPI003597717F